MRRRSTSLALLSMALVLPAAAEAKPVKAAAAEPAKVLVVTSTQDALSAAGIAAIQSGAASGNYAVTAPAPAAVGAQFTPANLDTYRTVVFLNTGIASPLTDAQRANFEAYFRKGGGFVGVGSAVETDTPWTFLGDVLGTRSSGRTDVQTGTLKVFDRVHDASKSLPEYWDRTDNFYNFTTNVRGVSHVLDTVVEDPFSAQPQGNTLDGIAGGTMGSNHPISWCKDYQGGRSFYTALGNTPAAFDATLGTHLKGAISWATGQSDPVYSDCGATVLKNYQQVKISAPPNVNEPVSFDQLPDGRIIQTARPGTVRLHDPVKGTTTVLADFGSAALPQTLRVYYNNAETGMYGGAVDNDFATNHWIYLYYAPQTVTNVKLSDGSIVTQTTPNTTPPNNSPTLAAWDPYIGYNQLSRFKLVDDGVNPPYLDLNSEQQILRVSDNRQRCCHVAGDIDFDKHNNLWMPTGDDNEAGGINAGGFGPFNDQLTDEQQTVRVTNATGGTFTLTFNGQTTAAIPFNATGGPDRRRARGALQRRCQQHPDQRRPGADRERQRVLPAHAAAVRPEPDHRRRRRPDGHDADGRDRYDHPWRQLPGPDRRHPPRRGQLQRPARQDPAHQGQGHDDRGRLQQGRPRRRQRRVHDPGEQPVPGRPAARRRPRPGRRSTRWASATRSACRWTRTTWPTCPTTRRTPTRSSARVARPARGATRSSARRPTTAGRRATRPSSATTSGTSRSSRPAAPRRASRPPPRRRPTTAGRRSRSTTRAGCATAGLASSPACASCPR